MKPSEALNPYREQVKSIVALHHAKNPRVFGSVALGLDTEHSDLDLLVDTTAETSLMDVAAIQVKLQKLLGVNVDVLTPRALPASFRGVVLAEAVPV